MSRRCGRLACVVLLAAACAPVEAPEVAPPVVERGELEVMTLNIWHDQGDWPARLELLLEGLRAANPDVVCLQEVLEKPGLPNQARTLAERLGYNVHFASWDSVGSPKRYGNAILTRRALLARGHRPLDPPDDYRVVAHVRIAPAVDTLDVYCTHLHHTQEGSEIRRTQVRDALDFIDETRGSGPTIFAGDFNAPVAAPELAAVRDRFIDAYGALHPRTADEVTTLNTELGHRFVRIDHVFYRPGTATELDPREARIVLDQPSAAGVWPSDHFGVLVRFTLQQEAPRRRRGLEGRRPSDS